MQLTVSSEAARQYIEDMELETGSYIRFVVRLYGQSSIHPNYSLGISKEPPRQIAIQSIAEGITFYFDEQDVWFLKNYHLQVVAEQGDIEFVFVEL